MSETILLPCPKLKWTREVSAYNSGELCVMVECDQFAIVATRFTCQFGRRSPLGGWMFVDIDTLIALDVLSEQIAHWLPATWARDVGTRVAEGYWTYMELLLRDLERQPLDATSSPVVVGAVELGAYS